MLAKVAAQRGAAVLQVQGDEGLSCLNGPKQSPAQSLLALTARVDSPPLRHHTPHIAATGTTGTTHRHHRHHTSPPQAPQA